MVSQSLGAVRRGACAAAVLGVLAAPAPCVAATPPNLSADPIQVTHRGDTVRISIDGSALFGTSTSQLRPSAGRVLKRVVPVVSRSSGPVIVIGFNCTSTDATPDAGWRRRAKAVATWLHVHGHIPVKRLRIKAPAAVRPSSRPAPAAIVITVKSPKPHA